MKAARDVRNDLQETYKYDHVKKQERKRTKELREKRKGRHNYSYE